MLETYCENKKTWTQVKPTCDAKHCKKFPGKKCWTKIPRKADAKWKFGDRMAKRLRTEKLRAEAATMGSQSSDDDDDDVTMSD